MKVMHLKSITCLCFFDVDMQWESSHICLIPYVFTFLSCKNLQIMLAKQVPSHSAFGAASRRIAPSTSTASRLAPTISQSQNRRFATVQDGMPKRTHGGLSDQDRIFTNLYGHGGADLKSAMRRGDWYRTKDIVSKGHEWVRSEGGDICKPMLTRKCSSFQRSKHLDSEDEEVRDSLRA